MAPRPAVLLAAGDIAECPLQADEATAALLDTLPGTIAALGDIAYERGSFQLEESGYRWRFIPTSGAPLDEGSATCH